MREPSTFVGLDVHKNHIQVAMLVPGEAPAIGTCAGSSLRPPGTIDTSRRSAGAFVSDVEANPPR